MSAKDGQNRMRQLKAPGAIAGLLVLTYVIGSKLSRDELVLSIEPSATVTYHRGVDLSRQFMPIETALNAGEVARFIDVINGAKEFSPPESRREYQFNIQPPFVRIHEVGIGYMFRRRMEIRAPDSRSELVRVYFSREFVDVTRRENTRIIKQHYRLSADQQQELKTLFAEIEARVGETPLIRAPTVQPEPIQR